MTSFCVADPCSSDFENDTFPMETVKIKQKFERIPTSFIIPEIITDSKKTPKHSGMFFSSWFWQCNAAAEALSLLNVWKTV